MGDDNALAWVAVTVLVLFPVTVVVYRLLFHPLAGVPGPKLAAATKLWQAYHYRQGKSLAGLHARYGSVVRIAPNEVACNTVEAYETIYRAGSPYLKSPWYDTLDFLNETVIPRYRLQRRMIGPIYTTGNIKKHEHVVDDVLQQFVAKLTDLGGKPVPLEEWMHVMAMANAATETLARVTFSKSFGYMELGSSKGTLGLALMQWRAWSVTGIFHWASFATFLHPIFKLLIPAILFVPILPWKFMPFINAWRFKATSVVERVTAVTDADISSSAATGILGGKMPPPLSGDPPADFLDDLCRLHAAKPQFNGSYLVNMGLTNLGAGGDTITASSTATLARVSNRPSSLRRVQAEIDSLRGGRAVDDAGPLSFEEITTRLPYTCACVREAMRLTPVVGTNLPRVAPPGTAPLIIHGHEIPAGTVVGCNPWALHRNRDVFGPDADEFRPERWLEDDRDDGDTERRRLMDRVSLVWGGATRSCPGRHLGEFVLYKAVAELFRQFEIKVELPRPVDDLPKFYFFALAKGGKARFTPRKGAALVM